VKALKIVIGAIVGLFVGSLLAFLAVGWQVRRTNPPLAPGEAVGIDINFILRDPVFWVVLMCSVVGVAYLFNRIGRSRRHARM
jgi:hypothetical protein